LTTWEFDRFQQIWWNLAAAEFLAGFQD